MISPCIGVCRVENSMCVGCLRTLDEIIDWTIYTPEERQEVLDKIAGLV